MDKWNKRKKEQEKKNDVALCTFSVECKRHRDQHSLRRVVHSRSFAFVRSLDLDPVLYTDIRETKRNIRFAGESVVARESVALNNFRDVSFMVSLMSRRVALSYKQTDAFRGHCASYVDPYSPLSGRKAGSGRHTRGGSRHSQERRSTDWPIAGRAELTPCATSAPPCESILLSDAEPTFSIRRRRDDALLTLPYAPQKIPNGVINARGVSRGYTRIRINRTFKINSGLLSWVKETPRASVRAGTSPS